MAGREANLTIKIAGEYNGRAIDRMQRQLHNASLAIARDSGGISQRMVETGDNIAALGNSMQHTGEKIYGYGTKLAKMTAPITAIGGASVKLASDYQQSVAKVYTIMDKNVMSTDKMSSSILDLSTATGKSATELAEASYQALSASVETSKVGGFVEQAVKLSKVGFTETATAVDTLTTIINAYGMSADDAAAISDKLVQTQNKGKTTVDELAQSMGNVIPTAAAYGVNLDNLSTAYVILTRQGINTANATTAINGMLTELADEGSNVNGILREMSGKSFAQLMEGGASLGDVLQMLNDSVDGDSEAFANLWGNVRASKGALAIANAGSEEFNRELESMEDCVGNVDDALTDLQTPASVANKAINALKNTGIELGQEILRQAVPTLQDLATKAQGLYKWFGNLDDGTKRTIVGVMGLATASGPLLMVFGKLYGSVGKLIATVGHGLQSMGVFANAMKQAEAAMRAEGAASVTLGQKLGGAAKQTGVLSKASNLLKGSIAMIGFAAVAALAAMLVKGYMELKEHTERVEKASTGLTDAIAAADVAYDGYGRTLELADQKQGTVAKSAEDCLKAQAELADTMTEKWQDVGTNAAMVDHYAGIIDELGDKGNLTATEQAELSDAVSNFNQLTGESIGIVDLQNGRLTVEKDKILEVAAAYQQQARAAAAQEMLIEVYKRRYENAAALKQAEDELTVAQKAYDQACKEGHGSQEVYNSTIGVAEQKVKELSSAIAEDDRAIGELTDEMAGSLKTYSSFDDALADCGVSISDLGDVSDETLGAMRSSFDGSLNSIVQACADNGVKIPKGIADGIKSNSQLPEDRAQVMLDAMVLKLTGGDIEKAAQLLGHAIDAGLEEGIRGDAEMPAEACKFMSQDVIDKAKSMFESRSPSRVMMRLGKDIDVGLKNGITGGKGLVSSAMTGIKLAAMAAVNGLPASMRTTGTKSGTGLASALGGTKGQAQGAGKTVANSAKAGADIAKDALQRIGKGSGINLRDALASVSAYGSGQKVANTAKSGAGSVSLWQTGKNLIAGLNAGILAADVYSAAKRTADKVLNTFRSAFREGSPSKAMREKGVNLGLGLIGDMRSMESAVAHEAASMAAAAMPEPKSTPAAAGAQMQAAAAQGARRNPYAAPILRVEVNVHGAVDAQSAAQTGEGISEAIYRGWKRYERAIA